MSWTTTGLEPAVARHHKAIDPGVMDVLSASMYNDEVTLDPNSTDKKEIPLGLVIEDSAADDEQTSRPKKRSRVNRASAAKGEDASDDSGKKHRGRPRIEAQDETAIDRRRTQIRLAQRAYRNRKETTIATLKQQNTDLQASIARLNDTFVRVYDDIVNSNLMSNFPKTLQDLSVLREELDHALVLSTTDEQSDNDQPNNTTRAKEQKPTRGGGQKNSEYTPMPSKPDVRSTAISLRSTNNYAEHSYLQYRPKPDEISYADVVSVDGRSTFPDTTSSSYFDWNPDMLMQVVMPESNTTNTSAVLPIQSWPIENLSLEKSFSPRTAYTYSFQETTFARRLHRMCLERSYRNLTNPHVDPMLLNRTFRFTFFFMSKNKLRDALQQVLQRKAGEPLENTNSPFFHIGGAGTHFPRRDAVGKPIFPPNLQSPVKAPGPWNLIASGNGPKDGETVQAMLEEMGYGGEWFDAHDVEEYLKSKGIYLDGTSSFVEIDPAKYSYSSGYKTSSIRSSSVPTLATSPASSNEYPPEPSIGLMGMDGNAMQHNSMADPLRFMNTMDHNGNRDVGSDYPSQFDWTTADMDHRVGSTSSSPEALSNFDHAIGRKPGMLTFDVERFLERVMEAGACLGRAPGYPKDAVDSALALAVQEAF